MKYLIPLFLLLVTPAFADSESDEPAAPRTNIGEHTGNYKLTKDRLGICPLTARVFSSEGLDGDSFQLWVGEWFFRDVNAGPQKFDNDFEKGVAESKYARNTLTFNRTWRHKIKNVNERQRVTASFHGENLRIVSHLWGSPPTERDCSFRRVKEEESDFGGDFDNSDGNAL
ncbi:MAG: hypothetical protein EOP11_04970 [Proteobacteria bacterium]|nr:MAG: hypothetical protein EOP11_04970 [Pseudomonadota bacterium]